MKNRISAIEYGSKSSVFTLPDGVTKIQLTDVLSYGGYSIVYKADEMKPGGITTSCIVKEYYPCEENTYSKDIQYVRDAIGSPVRIRYRTKQALNLEIRLRDKNIKRELMTNQRLLYERGIDTANNPNMYQASEIMLFPDGDSRYIKIESTEGMTLTQLMSKCKKGHLDLKRAIHIVTQMLDALSFISANDYVHGDIAPDNIWITGKNEQEHVVFLDFGSAFHVSDYIVKDMYSEEEVEKVAELIMSNVSLGSSHESTRAFLFTELADVRERYRKSPGNENAKRLCEIMSRMGESVDVHSCLKVFFYILTGTQYNNQNNKEEVFRKIICQEIGETEKQESIVNFLLSMMKKNDVKKYLTTSQARRDFERLEEIIDGKGGGMKYLPDQTWIALVR